MICLSIVIPAFNEEVRLANTLERIFVYLQQQRLASEVIVVDDGSTDATAAVAQALLQRFGQGVLLQNGVNRGKGYSVRQGVLRSQGEYVLFSDADLSTPIEEVEKLLAVLDAGADIAIGSRGLAASDVQIHQPWYRERMGKIFNAILRAFRLTPFTDTQCGFKCFRGEVARALFRQQRIDHFSFDVEILFLAARQRYRIREVAVQWCDEPHSRVHPFYDALKMFRDVLRIRWNAWRGIYPARAQQKGA